MMDTATAARAIGGRLIGRNVRFARVTTDSRALEPGDLFVALKGERFDGHDFVATAFERGAAAALVSEGYSPHSEASLIAVPNSLSGLGELARHWRSRFAIPVVAVVGSNGKTTVKEMLASILRAQHGDEHVLATRGNLNNAIGLPLTVLRLNEAHRAAVIELGMNHPGETAELGTIVQPTVALINNAQREHQEFMHSVEEVAAEHGRLLPCLGPGGTAVVNGDDTHLEVWRRATPAHARFLTFGVSRGCDVRGELSPSADGVRVRIAYAGAEHEGSVAAAGRHNGTNALAAAAGAFATGASFNAVMRGLAAFRPVAGRLVPMRAVGGAAVIDDSYNANPDSVHAAIAVLAAMPSPRWLVLGDMGEVGAQGPSFHREVGAAAKATGIEHLLAAGTLAQDAVAAFGHGGEHFASVEALADALVARVSPEATVLIKGSRFMRMERVVARLCAVEGGGH